MAKLTIEDKLQSIADALRSGTYTDTDWTTNVEDKLNAIGDSSAYIAQTITGIKQDYTAYDARLTADETKIDTATATATTAASAANAASATATAAQQTAESVSGKADSAVAKAESAAATAESAASAANAAQTAAQTAQETAESAAASVKNGRYPIVESTAAEMELAPNTYYVWGEMAELTVTLGAEIADGYTNEYCFEFTSGDTATALTVPESIKWVAEPSVESGKTYQVSIINGIGVMVGA